MKVAELSDLPEIADMSMMFIKTTGYADFSDRETIEGLIEALITSEQNEKIIILEPGVGFIAGTAVPFLFGPHRLATEIAWWVMPEARGSGVGLDLLHAFEYWAKEKAGCNMISMVCLDDALCKVYEDKGYKLYERAYMKEL